MKKLYLALGLLVLAVGGFILFRQQQPAPTQSIFDYLTHEDAIQLTLETDFAPLMENKDSADYQDALLRIKKPAGEEICLPLEVRPRGVFRKAMCDFPPLKLKFSDKTLVKHGYKNYNSLKLVTHCKADSTFDQLIFKEYLAFRIYNILTERSFRVQLAKMQYKDTEGRFPDVQRFGFIIEPSEELADRLDGRVIPEGTPAPKSIDKNQYKLFTVFQYMVGNTDWSFSNYHNAEFIQPNNEQLPMPFPVPYDFDFCGMVDAPYATPHHSIPISSVKERYFQWRGGKDEDFSDVFDLFKSKQTAIMDLCRSFKHLSDECRGGVEAYLGSFYSMLDTPEAIVKRD